MFDETMKTFMRVVKYGSFSKTAEVMYLSPNAIKKRIKVLEEQTGVILFLRDNKGVTLTKAGKSLYDDFTLIHERYGEAVEKARRIQNAPYGVLCMGMMNTFSDTFTTNSWYEVRKKFRQNPVHLIYYGNTLSNMDDMFNDIGKHIDMCIDVYDPGIARKYDLSAQKISDFRLYVGIPDDTNMRVETSISFKGLEGQTLSALRYGRSRTFDMVYDKIRKEYPAICMEEISEYSLRVFNDCYVKKNCVLVTENQVGLYPFYSFYPLEFEPAVSFGVYYSGDAEKPVDAFIDKIMPMT